MEIKKSDVILITGAAGFIGSNMAKELNTLGFYNLIIVDDFKNSTKTANWKEIKTKNIIERNILFTWLSEHNVKISYIIHLGARTDTTEFDYSIHEKLNVEYSKSIWNYCVKNNVPLIYASSAATYGNGEYGYNDDHKIIEQLKPLNPYGISKNEFDKWAIKQQKSPPIWAGLKFFNVYGPDEYHKGRMASVIFHAYNQIKTGDGVKLFKSHNPLFDDGEQLRDFIYVKDILKVIIWMINNEFTSGLYNLGTGKARSFVDLVTALYTALDKEPNIEFIDMPEDLRDKYQYFTQANMEKVQTAHYDAEFFS